MTSQEAGVAIFMDACRSQLQAPLGAVWVDSCQDMEQAVLLDSGWGGGGVREMRKLGPRWREKGRDF